MRFKLKAVHDADLENYLMSLGILDGIKNGDFKCKYCGTTITLENLLCLYPVNEEISICCDRPSCYQMALKEAEKENLNLG